jgi:hypothetical protein
MMNIAEPTATSPFVLSPVMRCRRWRSRRKNPDTYLPYVAKTLNNLGILTIAQNRMDEARQAFEEALGIFQRFAARDPEQFRADVARLEQRLSRLWS